MRSRLTWLSSTRLTGQLVSLCPLTGQLVNLCPLTGQLASCGQPRGSAELRWFPMPTMNNRILSTVLYSVHVKQLPTLENYVVFLQILLVK